MLSKLDTCDKIDQVAAVSRGKITGSHLPLALRSQVKATVSRITHMGIGSSVWRNSSIYCII